MKNIHMIYMHFCQDLYEKKQCKKPQNPLKWTDLTG